MLSLGLAFSIKAQATFFLPFLAIMAIRKKIPWLYFGMMPLVYLLAILPVVMLGRPFLDALLIYKKQAVTYSVISMYAPNAYILVPNEWYSWLTPIGLIATAIVTCPLGPRHGEEQNQFRGQAHRSYRFPLRGAGSLPPPQNARPLFLPCGCIVHPACVLLARVMVYPDILSIRLDQRDFDLSI